MKGIILAAGLGTRLYPLTKVTSKELLPVYNKPMVYYPLNTLVKSGITDILIIVAPGKMENYLKTLGNGEEFGIKITYKIQEKPKGLADAFIVGEDFIGDDNVTMILGDNIFEQDFIEDIKNFKSGAKVFAKKVSDPERFGVVKFNEDMKAETIIEKPKKWISDYALVGLYVYDNRVIDIAKNVQPSERGEMEIVDLHNWYLEHGELEVAMVNKEWLDAGTFETLYKAQTLAHDKLRNKMII